MKWNVSRGFALLLMVFALLAPSGVAEADSVVHMRIFDASAGMVEVTSSPAALIVGHNYYLLAQNTATSAPGSKRLDLDMGAITPYWTVTGQGHVDFHTSGSVSCSWSGTKYSCTASGADTISYVHVTATAVNATVVQSMIARSATPTGLHITQYVIN